MRSLRPSSIALPFARYSHGIEVPAGYRLVLTSGQLGIGPESAVPPNCAGQAAICFANIQAILHEAGMTLAHVVRLNAFVTDRVHMSGYMEVRDRLFAGNPPASTLIIVAGFTRPEFVVEIEAMAAAP